METATDPYATLRSVYLQNRQTEIQGDLGGKDRPLPDFDDPGAAAQPDPAKAEPSKDGPPKDSVPDPKLTEPQGVAPVAPRRLFRRSRR